MAAGRKSGGRRGSPGGILSDTAIEAATTALILGLPGWRLISTGDETERVVVQAMTSKAIELHAQRDKALAAHIANAVSRIFK
jgi:hypothetical protein